MMDGPLSQRARDEANGTLLTPQVAQDFCALVARGYTKTQAARAMGLHPPAVTDWLRRGRVDYDGDFVNFLREVNKAQAAYQEKLVKGVEVSSDWRASAWLLERLFPEQYGNQRREVAALRKMVKELQIELAKALGVAMPQIAAGDDDVEVRLIGTRDNGEPQSG